MVVSAALFYSLLSLASCLHVLHPPHRSPVEFADDQGLVLTYRSRGQGMIKVDVHGYGDPNGWPGTVISGLRRTGEEVEGTIALYSLKPGAVKIRIRLLTEDGRDAVEEVEVEYFVQPVRFFQQVFRSNVWVQQRAGVEVRNCCGQQVDECMHPDVSWLFCEAAMEMVEEREREERKEEIAAAEGCRSHERNAVFAMVYGYDVERLFPLVQSLRGAGFRGDIHLVHANPEVACEQESESCRRMLRYLDHENVTRHFFPDEVDWGRQHLSFHDGLIVSLLLGHFAHKHGGRYQRILFLNGMYTIFQADPFQRVDAACSLLVSHKAPDDGRWSSCMEVEALRSHQLLRGDFAMGSAAALVEHAANVVLLYWKLVTARGTRCSLKLDYFASATVSWREERGEEVKRIREGGDVVVSLVDQELLCHAGSFNMTICEKLQGRADSAISRQRCLNSGCCFARSEGFVPVCYEPARRGDAAADYESSDGRIYVEEKKQLPAIVLNSKSEDEFIVSFWKRHAAVLQKFFPSKTSENKHLPNRMSSTIFPPHPQQRAERMISSGAWRKETEEEDIWDSDDKFVKSSEELVSLLHDVDIHLFGDSRMRALSFSLMRLLFPAVDDTDENLKDLVVPIEHADLCGGNKRYQNHVACASKMGFSIKTDNISVSFHELFHFDHGPTLAAMIDSFLLQARRQGRRLLLVMAPGFHFISQAPFDAASMMASFLPQIVDAVWDMDWRFELPVWLTMEPTIGGRGSWPELEAVNEVARRTWGLTGAAVVLDLYSLALPRPDLLTDGSHYSFRYRRQAAALLLSLLCREQEGGSSEDGGREVKGREGG